jgi:4a-hydroxytetrahydrobiopterin dehydratase
MARPTALTEPQITERLSSLPGWERDGMIIRKTFAMETYMTGLAFASAVGTVCEALDHHPDIIIGWRRVSVSFTTHDAGNMLTANDFDAADAVEGLRYPKASA